MVGAWGVAVRRGHVGALGALAPPGSGSSAVLCTQGKCARGAAAAAAAAAVSCVHASKLAPCAAPGHRTPEAPVMDSTREAGQAECGISTRAKCEHGQLARRCTAPTVRRLQHRPPPVQPLPARHLLGRLGHCHDCCHGCCECTSKTRVGVLGERCRARHPWSGGVGGRSGRGGGGCGRAEVVRRGCWCCWV